MQIIQTRGVIDTRLTDHIAETDTRAETDTTTDIETRIGEIADFSHKADQIVEAGQVADRINGNQKNVTQE